MIQTVDAPPQAGASARPLSFSFVISTRNRPQDLERCLESLTSVEYPAWDVLVVDQSELEQSDPRPVIERFIDRLPGLTYMHMDEKGVCRARNLGLSATRGDVVFLLDDDCTVTDPAILDQAVAVLDRNPRAAIAFGRVVAVAHDSNRGFIPTQDYAREQLVRSRAEFQTLKGLTACMCVRRSLAATLMFDVHLGPGSRFNFGGDDVDYGFRALKAGHMIAVSPTFGVDHYGFRDYAGGAATTVAKGYMYSLGAQNMKMLRSGDLGALGLMARQLVGLTAAVNLRNVVMRVGPTNLGRFVYYSQGLAASFKYGVDRHSCLYV
jgi:glycosyltransferase involved in cell wall biosynthesis